MADNLPTDQYDQFAQQQEDASRNIYDFWNQQFAKFNPVAPQIQPVNTLGGFQNAGQKTIQGAQGLMGGSGAPGAMNTNRMNENIMNREQTKGLNQNLGNDLSAMGQNYETNLAYGQGGFGRMGELAGMEGKVNELPLDRMGQGLATSDTINSMWNNYNASKPDWFESLLGGIGEVGGTLAGKKLGGIKSTPKPPMPPMNDYAIGNDWGIPNG